ncbi:MAG: hypothetical protein ACON5F_10165 [Jejuia sp.]
MKFKLIAAFIFTTFNLLCAYSKDIYVSPNGHDENTGSLEYPLKTLERARDLVRPYLGKEKVNVFLRGGLYRLKETFVLTEKDSGTKDYPVVYQAFKNETPVISGGVLISNWQKAGNYIYKAPTGGKLFRQLYSNSKKGIRSKFPNDGYFKLKGWNKNNKTIHIDKNILNDWQNFNEVEIFVQMSWSVSIMRLKEFDPKLDFDALSVQNPEKDLVFKRKFPPRKPNQSFHFENAREFIDMPGEWSLDSKNEYVYFYPYENQNPNNQQITVPSLETLFHIKGVPSKPVKFLTVKGLKFMHTNWVRPSLKGYLNIQAGQYNVEPTYENIQYVERPPAAVLVQNAYNVKIERNYFNQIGAVALDLHFGTTNCEIVGNVFYEISGTSISHSKLSDPGVEIHIPYNPKDKRELCVNDKINNNFITKSGFDYGGAIGILSGWPVGLKIDHNELKDLAYTGISVGWGWTHESNAMKNNFIRWNKIDNPCSLYGDGGGIYTLSNMPGSLIYRNYILNVKRSEWATGASTKCLYLDEGSSGITLQENYAQAEEGIERLRLHVTGDIHVKTKKFSMYESIKKGAGLEEQFKDIKNIILTNE